MSSVAGKVEKNPAPALVETSGGTNTPGSDVDSLVEETLETLRRVAKQKGISVAQQTEEYIGLFLQMFDLASPEQLDRVIYALEYQLLSASVELKNIGFNKKELLTKTDIAAPPEVVWKTLIDFASYQEWNPFMNFVSGELKVGGKLSARFHFSDGKSTSFSVDILGVKPPLELKWRERISRFLEGEHVFEIKPLAGGKRARLVQREVYSGIFLSLSSGLLKDGMSRGFIEFNNALKERAERSL
jgi:hypothetical protein